MKHPRWLKLAAGLAVAAAVYAGAAAPAAAAPDPAAAAVAYLEARGAAVTASAPAAPLARWLAGAPALAAREAAVARGTARRAAGLGHSIDSVSTAVTVTGVVMQGDAATVSAHVVTRTAWHTAAGAVDVEASGMDHRVALCLDGDAWRVTGDRYVDVQLAAILEAARAPAAMVQAAERRAESSGAGQPAPAPAQTRSAAPAKERRYSSIIVYDRDAARAYADRYALSYNPTFVRFSADCANFASQCARSGGMPESGSAWDSGWWYDKSDSSTPGDDSYSWSWISVSRQTGFWNTRRTDWVTSITGLSRGDFVYYDWSGDGVWDHAAVVAGTNSAGQRIIDAHTTDYYHVYWKLGSSSTKYRFARVQPQWVIGVGAPGA
jgi:hypothetical protein